ncbi:MAG: hypothetical protein L0H96_18650 [Humibacillus sp.]|nr:hypothetical protein [Humibacillus sp.]
MWRQAALAPLQGARRVDPPTETLRRLTEPDAAWVGIIGWPLSALDDRIGRLFDCHHLAVALADVTWLRRLHEAWSVAPRDVDELRVLRATGEIGLGLGADGDRPHGWSAEEIHDLVAEGFLLPHAPSERAWLALARGDLVEARTAVEDAARARPAAGVPGTVLDVELRALGSLSRQPSG